MFEVLPTASRVSRPNSTRRVSTLTIPRIASTYRPSLATVSISRALAALLAAALVLPVAPALAMTPQRTPGWNPASPPAQRDVFDWRMARALYRVSCGDVSATGWSADASEDAQAGIRATLVTTASAACIGRPGDVRAWRKDTTVSVTPYGLDRTGRIGTLVAAEDLGFIDWDFVPTPRVGQWVGIGAAAPDGTLLPMREQRIVSVDADTFTLDAPLGEEYVGAPVVDNQARVLGMVTTAGARITGAPQFCADLFVCTDPSKVWWDITAPSAPVDLRVTPGKGRVTFAWKPVADTGGDEVAYWYRVGSGVDIKTDTFRVTVKARKGQRVTLSVIGVNQAGNGPSVTKSAKAK